MLISASTGNAYYKTNASTFVPQLIGRLETLVEDVYDSWSFIAKVLDSPDYGFPDATCINEDGTSCVWWNDYHPGSKYREPQAEDMKASLGPLGAW